MVAIINECVNGLNHLGNAFSRYAVRGFLQSAVLVIVLFGIDLLLRKRVRAVFRYCIWLLVLVKLILPPTLSLPTGIGYWVPDPVPARFITPGPYVDVDRSEDVEGPLSSRPEPSDAVPPVQSSAAVVAPDDPVIPAAVSLTPITWKAIGLLFWLAGVLAFAVVLAQRMRFVSGLVAASRAAQGQLLDLLEACRRQIGVRGRVELRISEALSSPAVCGLLRPTILMPASLVTKLSPKGLKATLTHELAHIKRADLWVNALQTVLQVVYFYNPFVWLANAMIRRTCEEAVDETVLVALGGQASDYSNTLISIGEMAFWKADFGLRLVGVAESKRALKRRIKHMLTRPIPQSARIGALGTIAILLIAAVLLPMARAERSNERASTPSSPAVTEASETTSPAEANDVIVDPNTGVKFVLAKTFSGANNVIRFTTKLILSPDARFLVSIGGLVVPLDGTGPFRCTERGDARDRAVSPDGRYIAHGGKAVWLQPVSPETLRPNGPAKKLLDLRGGQLVGRNNGKGLYWTRDSQTVFFQAYDVEGRFHPYAFSAATGASVSYPDAASAGLPSPDGKCIALTITDPAGGFWVKPIGEGAARLLGERPQGEPRPPMCWSKDGHWLIGAQVDGTVRFVRYPEGQEYLVPLPKELAHDLDDYSGTYCAGPSADGSRLFFYQTGYTVKWRMKVASAQGAALRDLDSDTRYAFRPFQWARDGKATFQTDYQVYPKQPETALLMSPLSGAKPAPFVLMPGVSARARPLAVSPDSKWLLFVSPQGSGNRTLDLNVISLSMADHSVSGPATLLLRVTRPARESSLAPAWSPDSTRVVLACKADPAGEEDIWVVFTNGTAPIRLTRTAAIERDLKWSPDGNMLAFICDDGGAGELKVVPTAGGEAVVIRRWAVADVPEWGWSPDGKSLTIAEEDMLVRQPLSGGKAEPIVNLKEYGIESLEWQGWSPDGSRLALAYGERNTEDPLASSTYLLFARVEGGRLEQTVKVRADGGNMYYTWSPDSTHVAYLCEDAVPVRPEGRLYAVTVDDIVERIEAGAIPPIRRKTSAPTAAEYPFESIPTAQVEPITGPVFSDNFDNGLSKYWQIVPGKPDASPPPAHAVEDGQLMLLNSSARLNQIDWADYLVTVRVCVKEGAAPRQGGVAIFARATPSNFGIEGVDQYTFLVSHPTSLLWLELYYANASGSLSAAVLSRNPCTLVRDKWYKLAFEVRGEHLRGYVDDKLVIEATDARLSKGPVSINAGSSPVLFDDFSVRRLTYNAD
ncbi:MAG: PD40 domain-containing protein [Phycisphaerae bacterium]|nr:PD40 domain-containing protein [Phycisphaerae bacterium]